MAAVRHGKAIWPGVKGVISCTYTISHGISPGVAILKALPQEEPYGEVGTLVITDGVETITLPDCKLENVVREQDGSGFVDSLQIVDRRWKWRDLGAIEGWYNQLDPNSKLLPWTIQSPTELAELCLAAMGEARFKIDLPAGFNSTIGHLVTLLAPPWIGVAPTTGTNPPVAWTHEVPAVALAALVESFGRRVIYRWSDDSVLIAKPGVGDQLPDGSLAKRVPSLKSPATPTGVEVVGDPTRYQAKFALTPMAKEWHGAYVPLDEVSYKPAAGWGKCFPPLFNGVQATDRLTLEEARALAQESVYRAYGLADIGPNGAAPIEVPGYGIIKRKQQIWLTDTQVEQVVPEPQVANLRDGTGLRPRTVNFYNGYSRDKPAAVYGSIANYLNLAGNAFWTDSANQNGNSPAGRQIFVPFSIDPVRQVVLFSSYVYRLAATERLAFGRFAGLALLASAAAAIILPSELILQTACLVRDPDTNAFERLRMSEILPGMKGLTNFASRLYPDVQANIIGKYDADNNVTGAEDLEEDAKVRAKYYLEGLKLQYLVQEGLTQEYNGIRAVDLDGAISQVTWSVGGSGASTTASRNSEHSIWIPPYPARRRAEWLPAAKQQQINQVVSTASESPSMSYG